MPYYFTAGCAVARPPHLLAPRALVLSVTRVLQAATVGRLTLFLLTMLLLGRSQPAAAQVRPLGALTGTVLDSASRQPVAYATVVLLPPGPNDKPLTGVGADDQGHFLLPQLAPGSYRLQVSFVGYATRTRAVAVAGGTTAVEPILLPTASQLLAEAVVVGTRPVVEVRPDRLVYNADRDLSNAGGTAADVLRKAPLLAVDGAGQVTMRGSANFKVLVNGKPAPALASNLAEALKSIPADQIQRVEVITTPPAKYDGEGTAGLINIVLKKGVRQGLNGSAGAAAGNRSTSLNGALNYRRGPVNFTSSASVVRWYNPSQFGRVRTGRDSLGAPLNELTQRGTTHNDGTFYYGTVGLDFDPAEHQRFALTGAFSGYDGQSAQQLFNQVVARDAAQNQLFSRATTTRFSALNVEGTGTYTRTFAQARREWSALAQYALTQGTFGYDFDQFANAPTPLDAGRADYREHSRGRTPGHEITLQTDYAQPLGEKNTLEMGLKAIFRRTGAVATVDTLRPEFGGRPAPDARRATDFGYAQDVQAAYATYTTEVGKHLSASLGSRLERTASTADFRASGTAPFRRQYLTALPGGHVRYAFGDETSLRLAYSRRITRPFIDYLNPFVDRSDAQNITYGNPALDPELTDAYELSYNSVFKALTYNASASVRHTGNAIELLRLPTADPRVTAQTYGNVAATTFYQLNLYGSAKPLPQWEVSGGPDVQYIVRRSAVLGTTRQGLTASLTLNTSYQLAHGLRVQSFGSAALPAPELQGQGPSRLYYSFGVRKTLFRDQADLTLNVANPFNSTWAARTTTTAPAFDEQYTYRPAVRSLRLSFSYRFGAASAARERKQISNDDQKSGPARPGRN